MTGDTSPKDPPEICHLRAFGVTPRDSTTMKKRQNNKVIPSLAECLGRTGEFSLKAG